MKKFWKGLVLLAVTASVSACSGKTGETKEGEAASVGSEQENQEQAGENGQETQNGGAGGESESQEPENTYTNLNEFQATALDGSTFTQEDFADKDLTLINFWALSCRPCIAEMPDLAELEKALPDNVQLITVCLDGAGNEELVEYVMEKSAFEGTTLLSGDGDLLTLSGELRYTPTTLFADSEGNIVGETIVGGKENLAEYYLRCINDILTDMEKAEISLDTDAE